MNLRKIVLANVMLFAMGTVMVQAQDNRTCNKGKEAKAQMEQCEKKAEAGADSVKVKCNEAKQECQKAKAECKDAKQECRDAAKKEKQCKKGACEGKKDAKCDKKAEKAKK